MADPYSVWVVWPEKATLSASSMQVVECPDKATARKRAEDLLDDLQPAKLEDTGSNFVVRVQDDGAS